MPLADVPTLVVIGARGAGKTRLIQRLLQARPRAERWAVLSNEAGRTAIASDDAVPVATVEDGCICCTAQVSLRVALTRLLRTARPSRLFIELSAGSHVGPALRVLRDPWLAPVVSIEAVVGLIDAECFSGQDGANAGLEAATMLWINGAIGEDLRRWLAARRVGVTVLDANDAAPESLIGNRF